MNHIKSCLPTSLDPLQFAYKSNQSMDDSLSTSAHLTLIHLENRNTYARILLIDLALHLIQSCQNSVLKICCCWVCILAYADDFGLFDRDGRQSDWAAQHLR